ncbi:MAG: cytochrome c, partial [Bradyrhizobium sp.]
MQRRLSRPCLPGIFAAATALLAAVLPAQAQTGAGSTDAGSRVYVANCVACHQAGGAGVAGAFPPLAGRVPDLLKQADGRSYVGKVLLFGLEGAISVNGNTYAGAMPAWNALGDDDIAAVLNYVSNAWDNG